ncbi:MAG: ABC transporter permease [Chloroflexi bacterium]|nr:ABC transporter permease [Chloroflexota bacterium]
MTSFLTIWQMVVKRSLSHWKLLSAVVVGVVLAVAIMASTVIYFDTLREMALRYALSQRSSKELDILIRAEHGPTDAQEYRKISIYAKQNIDKRVGWLVRERFFGIKSSTFDVALPGQEEMAGKDNKRAYFQFLHNLEQHVQVIEGRLPRPMEYENLEGKPIEVAITPDTAETFGMTVGSRLATVPYWDDVSSHATVIITGIVQRRDPGEIYWTPEQEVFSFQSPTLQFAPLFVPEKTYVEVVGSMFPRMSSTYSWLLDTDPGRIHSLTAVKAKKDIEILKRELGSTLTSYKQATVLNEVLGRFDRRLFFSKLPIFFVLIIIVAVILYYVVIVSSLLVERQRGEIALLRSRGASSTQILAVYVMEGGIIASLAILVGPIIAVAGITVLGSTPAFSDLTGGRLVIAQLSGEALVMSLLGGLISFLALLIPAVQASRIGLLHYKQQISRPTATPVFQRYYLDIIFLAVGILLFREIGRQGSVVAKDLLGEEIVNNLLLAMPALILIGAAMLLLRFFPITMRLLSRLLSPVLPAGVALGLWQMARNPTHYARLALLLILAAGLGVFTASFSGTLDRNFRERALYTTGADLRLEGMTSSQSGHSDSFLESYKKIDGISKVSPAYRGRGIISSTLDAKSYTMFAIDPETLPGVAWFREDFASKPLDELLQPLTAIDLPEGIKFPKEASTLGLWIRPDKPYPSIGIQAHLRDSEGRYFTFPLGNLEDRDWRYLETSLASLRRGRTTISPTPPLTLVSLFITERRSAAVSIAAGSVLMDDIQIRLSNGDILNVEPFEDVSKWRVLRRGPTQAKDSLDFSEIGANGGRGAGLFTWSSGSALLARGIYHGPDMSPIPVLASASFMADTGYRVGERLDVSLSGFGGIPVMIADAVNYFPTLNPYLDRFIIADIKAVSRLMNLDPGFLELQPNEAWLSTDLKGSVRSDLISRIKKDSFTIRELSDREAYLTDSRVDPLVAAGWRALLFVSFFTVLIVSSLGFLIHTYVSFQARQMEFALLRTIGLSFRQLITLVWLEQILIVGVGMALGTWMGGRLGATVMPFLSHTDEGLQALPPFIMEVNWVALAITYVLIAIFFSLIILGSIWFVYRIHIQRVLRMGEM